MKKRYVLASFLVVVLAFIIYSCSESDDEYTPIEEISPVTVDLTQVPYPKLSDYKLFDGPLKDQKPSLDVLPYQPASSLFTDYALKKRFVWMPKGVKATYNGDGKVLELPVGAALIKNFYYENVQNVTPVGATRIIETRVMIRKSDGWIFADYKWNDDQTEAVLDLVGSFTTVTWLEGSETKTADYRIPSLAQCIVCHKAKEVVNNTEETRFIPIGIKPQNLNFDYNFGTESVNQLIKWIEKGYLQAGFSLPSIANTTVNYADATKPVAMRARSYVDANCAHCHETERHCDYRPMMFAFESTGNAHGEENMGVCVNTSDMQGFPDALNKIVTPRSIERSMMYYRLNTTNETYRMPLHGRTLIHTEGVALIEEWINSLHECE